MSLTRLIVKAAAPLPRIESFERYLFIGPHPDDIEIGAGATAAKLAAAGKQVRFLICTDGRYGDAGCPGISGDELAALRKEEALASAKALGVNDVHFLELSDGGFYSRKDLLKGIAREVGAFAPDLIFAPDPSPASECHVDHLNVGKASRQIACFAPYAGIMGRYKAASAPVKGIAFYMTAKPNAFVKTSPALVKQQFPAIFDCHKSQYPEGCGEAKSISLYLTVRSVDFGLRAFSSRAEGFRFLDQTHMHCLPEGGD